MDRIRESFDSLPVAICFFDKNGVVRLINHRMLMLTDRLRKNGIQTFDELEAALEQPPETVCCLNKELQLYRFFDQSVFQFTQKAIRTKLGIPYTQVTACDVTELLQSQNRLQKENERLKDANDRLRKLFEQMPDLIREEETLAMKLRVHDDIGYSILSARRLLSQQAGLDEIRAGAAVWEQSIEVLYRSFKTDEKQDALEEAVRRAEEMGIDVLLRGVLPKEGRSREIIALAVYECAANGIRHAGATKLQVQLSAGEGCTQVLVTNNGEHPKEEITEGGGLTMLRHRVEETGGKMQVQSRPCFRLMLSLWKGENDR